MSEARNDYDDGLDTQTDLSLVEETKIAKVKARVFDLDEDPMTARAVEEDKVVFGKTTIRPPLHPKALVNRYDQSHALRPNIDAYVNNIHGHGHRLELRIDLDKSDSDEKIRDAMLMRRLYEETELAEIGVTDEDLEAFKQAMKVAARIERLRLEAFFAGPSADESFIRLRKNLARDLEVTGNAYIEVSRNPTTNNISQLGHVRSITMRLNKLGPPREVPVKRRISPVDFITINVHRRYRQFVQRLDSTHDRVFFKEIGDPRVMSAKTGRYYPSVKALRENEKEQATATRLGMNEPLVANEIVHLKLYDPQSPYGTPRWQGAVMAVVGTRAAEEVNASYFDEKTIPPGMLLVAGAPLAKGAVAKIEQYLKDKVKGRRNFHNMLVIEAEPKPPSPNQTAIPRITLNWVPLTGSHQNDALFQNYDERNAEKVGNMFRLPKILRGDMRDFNRATADAALKYAEEQVFDPERRDFDEVINDVLFPHMGVRYWKFVSNSPVTRDPEALSEIIDKTKHALTIEEQRKIVGRDIVNDDLEVLDPLENPWVKQPKWLTEAQGAAKAAAEPKSGERGPEDGEGGGEAVSALASTLRSMREHLTSAAQEQRRVAKDLIRSVSALPQEVIPREKLILPGSEFEALFGDSDSDHVEIVDTTED